MNWEREVPESIRKLFSFLPPHCLLSIDERYWKEIEKGVKEVSKKKKPYITYDFEGNGDVSSLNILVVARDWAGLVDAVVGTVHQRGYNIHYLLGLVTSDWEYGIILTKILLRDEDEIKRAREDVNLLISFLRAVSVGGKSVQKLIHVGTRKLEIYHKVVTVLKEMCNEEEFKELIKEGGEVEAFTISRSEAYLEERRPEDLARLILTNFRFQNQIREGKARVKVMVENIETVRERLTGISVAGLEGDISMDDVLEALRDFIPGFQRKYDKLFITPDGILVIRVEITDENGEPLKEDELPLLERHLRSRLLRRRLRELIDLKTGSELFGRVLVPRLIQEAEKSGIPQLYILPERITRGMGEFRLVLVAPLNGKPLGEIRDRVIDSLSKIKGLIVSSAKAPTPYRNFEVDILTIKAILAEFESPERIYDMIKAFLLKILPDIRDFDEGMRSADQKKLKNLLEKVKERGVDPRFAHLYYYEMDDFYRISTPEEELIEEISFADRLLREYIALGASRPKVEALDKMKTILIGVVGPSGSIPVESFLKELAPFDPILTRIEEYEATILVFVLKRKKVKEPLNDLLDRLREIPKNVST
jgi:acetolactate synthase small subunit